MLITDRDGVPLVRVLKEVPELGVKPSFLATFATATDQAGKLGLGKNRNIISVYSNYQVGVRAARRGAFRVTPESFQIVQMNKLPLIVTFIGDENCNIGHVLAIESEIEPYLDEINSIFLPDAQGL